MEVSVGEGVSVCVGTGEGDWVGLDVGKNVTFAMGMDGCAVLVGTSGTGKLTCALQPVVKGQRHHNKQKYKFRHVDILR